MNILKSPASAILKYKERNNSKNALIPVIITALCTSFYKGNMDWMSAIVVNFSLNLSLYFIACAAFKLAAIVNNKEVTYKEILSTWAFSYLPTLSFVAYIWITHLFFLKVRIGFTTPLSIILLAVLIAIFIWKSIFYFIELRVVLKMNFTEMIVGSIIIGAIFTVTYMITGKVFDFKIPIV
ncbi:MAG: hypothetical protein ACM3X7_05745 [Solirubrobacterales bacterium]